MDIVFDAALDQWHDWETTAGQWFLLNGNYVPDRAAHVWVSDVVAWEVLVSNYQRQLTVNRTRTLDTTLHRIVYNCDGPNFGGMDLSPPGVAFLCVAKTGADDASSMLLAVYDLVNIGTGPLKPLVSPNGVYWISQAEDA